MTTKHITVFSAIAMTATLVGLGIQPVYAERPTLRPQSSSNSSDERGNRRVKNPIACQNLQNNIQKRLSKINNRTKRHLDVVDKVYDNAIKYAGEQDIAISPTQLQNATDAKNLATKALVDFNDNVTKFDCNSDQFGVVSSSLRIQIDQLRNALRAYRLSVKDIIDSLRVATDNDVGAGNTARTDTTNTETN